MIGSKPVKLFARPYSFWHEYAPFWVVAILLLAWLGGLWQGHRMERQICAIQLTSKEQIIEGERSAHRLVREALTRGRR